MSSFLRLTTAVSTAVLAVCAVVVTVHLLSGGAVRVEQLRTFDALELSTSVAARVKEQYPGTGLDWTSSPPPCPASVAIKEGVTFTCTFRDDDKSRQVRVVVKDTLSGELEVSAPTS
ncbi:DUF4333 domain-containing protein [Actinosynnema sp. NPDC050801]|uniref:DUF4333 domain-containing protein n=1 Tax=unclassified Actinosynnema TaxID=2637065 RepID=UPI0033D048E5